MSVRAGQLRHRLVIKQKIDTPSGTGGIVPSWQPFKTLWGRLASLSGREYLAAQQTQSKVLAKATVRAPSGIQPRMQLTCRGVIYNIEAVLPDPDSMLEYETLMLSQGLTSG